MNTSNLYTTDYTNCAVFAFSKKQAVKNFKSKWGMEVKESELVILKND